MTPFFSIEIQHEYDKLDNRAQVSTDLSIIPAGLCNKLIKKNRLFCYKQGGAIQCFVKDVDTFKEDVDVLFFWVVCVNEAFFSYTDFPATINFSKPYYFWSNNRDTDILEERDSCFLHPGRPSKNSIGCIAINTKQLSDFQTFKVQFKVRETYWVYNIHFQAKQKDWSYKIEDRIEENNNQLQTRKWQFKEVSKNDERIIFQSVEPIPYAKKATDRLELSWNNTKSNSFDEDYKMVLKYPSYKYKMVSEDNKELTPVYIHI